MSADLPDDYYALLGIDSDADASVLRRAWRLLALRWHPDRAGAGATATFQTISAAYAVLSDPVARAAYDRGRGISPRRPGANAAPAQPAGTRRRAPGVMLSRLTGSLHALLASGAARRAEGNTIELLPNAEEVAQGGMVSISMRVQIHCPECEAAESTKCVRCGARGTVDELFSAWLAVPPEVADGTLLEPSALLRGMVRPVSFRVRLRNARP